MKMGEKAKVVVVFTCRKPGVPHWPYINYNYERRAKEIMKNLRANLPEIEFTEYMLYSREEAEKVLKKSEGIDGFVVYMTSNLAGVVETITKSGYPVVLVNDLYAGSGEFLRAFSQVKKKRLPVVGVTSSRFEDVMETLNLFKVLRSMKKAKILAVADRDISEIAESIQRTFGTRVITMSSSELNSYYNSVNEGEARRWANKWINEALKVVESLRKDVVKSAKIYLALKKAMEDNGADAVTVDCLRLVYSGKIPAHPCLAFFQLNNEGSTGMCEADLDSTVTQLLMRYLTGRPGYVSDPVIDTAANQIIYTHCTATNRVFGPKGPSNQYIIRSHSEDRKGASVQSLMPLREIVTTIKINTIEKAMSIHQGKAVINVKEDKACRTKLAAEANTEKILNNWNKEVDWGWHRVTFYGDWKKRVMDLATLLGINVFEEDK